MLGQLSHFLQLNYRDWETAQAIPYSPSPNAWINIDNDNEYYAGIKVALRATTGYGGWSKEDSQNTSESKSENEGANKSRSETTSTSGSRNVMVWPKYGKNGELEHIYMVILNGDYKNISTEFRRD